MANLSSALNEQIKRLARREVKEQLVSIRKLTARYRADVAALKKQFAEVIRPAKSAAASFGGRQSDDDDADSQGNRFRADGLRSHRAKLGLSALDYGRLIGVSALTIYSYESGKSRPRATQLAKLVAIRGIGKREALKRLGQDDEA